MNKYIPKQYFGSYVKSSDYFKVLRKIKIKFEVFSAVINFKILIPFPLIKRNKTWINSKTIHNINNWEDW